MEKVLDIVDQFRLNSVAKPSKKLYQAHLKSRSRPEDAFKPLTVVLDYFKKITTYMKENGKSDEEVKAWQGEAAKSAKTILGGFDDYDFYTGESMEEDSMYVLVNYREDGVTPYALIWKDGVKEMKV